MNTRNVYHLALWDFYYLIKSSTSQTLKVTVLLENFIILLKYSDTTFSIPIQYQHILGGNGQYQFNTDTLPHRHYSQETTGNSNNSHHTNTHFVILINCSLLVLWPLITTITIVYGFNTIYGFKEINLISWLTCNILKLMLVADFFQRIHGLLNSV